MSVTMTENSVGQSLLAAYLEPLLAGERVACRQTIERAFSDGCGAAQLLTDLIWPAMEKIQALYREDRISQSSLNLATRLNRSLTDQIAARLDAQGGQWTQRPDLLRRRRAGRTRRPDHRRSLRGRRLGGPLRRRRSGRR
jgi:methanogenic corrinoid protein MtbC1